MKKHLLHPTPPAAPTVDWTRSLDEAIDALAEPMVELRRRMHAQPDPSGFEQDTSQHLYGLLGDEGFEVRIGPEGRGVLADLGNGETPRVAIRADIDALRIQDQKSAPYRSQRPGVMHACGHDAHSAIVYGALVALRRLADDGRLPWPVDLRGVFQPSEETALGAAEMVASGALDGVQAIIALHVDPTRPAGKVAIRPGALTANCDSMRLVISGQGGHAARPHESKDPIAAAAQLISTLYQFVPRATDSHDAVVVTIGQIHGGENPNVIPESVELSGTLRTQSQRVRQATIAHIRQLAHGIGEVSGTSISVNFDAGTAGVQNDPRITRLICDAAIEVVGEENLEEIERPSMGSEDFAVYLDHVPGAMFRLGCGMASGGGPLHTPRFDVDERALPVGAKVLARTAVRLAAPADDG